MRELMMKIREVFIEWQGAKISDRTAVQRIETLILENQREEWKQEHV
jgi:hypothetical protein